MSLYKYIYFYHKTKILKLIYKCYFCFVMDLSQKEWMSGLKKDEDSVIVDVRTTEEHLDGHIQNSILIDTRGIFEPQDAKDTNLIFRGLGRGD